MINVTCRDRRYVNRTRTLGVRVENVINLVEKRGSRGTILQELNVTKDISCSPNRLGIRIMDL